MAAAGSEEVGSGLAADSSDDSVYDVSSGGASLSISD